MGKTKSHTAYKTEDGARVPSVTTVIALLDKPALHHWIAKVTREGLDWTKVRDEAASIGTLAHAMIFSRLKNEDMDMSEYSQSDIARANDCLGKYIKWEEEHPKIEDIMLETPMVSQRYSYGGTIDRLCVINGVFTIIDYKTGKAIYDDMWLQMAAYMQLAKEHGYPVKAARILRIGRDEAEGFEEQVKTDLKNEWQVFKRLREIYELRN